MKAKKLIKKAAALILTLIIAAMAIPAYAGEFDDIPQVVFVDGVTITESGYWRYNLNEQLVEASKLNYDVAYDADTNTLTLNNTTVSSNDFSNYNEYKFEASCAIASSKDLNINLIGENKLDVWGSSGYDHFGSYGIISFYGNIHVSGEGSLDIWMRNCGKRYGAVARNGLVSIEDTQVTVYTTEDRGGTYYYGIWAPNVEIENSTLNIDLESLTEIYGIYDAANGSCAKIRNSDVNINIYNENYVIEDLPEGGVYRDYYCKAAYGFNIYQVDIKDSTVDVNIAYSSNPAYGIFTYSFLCDNSYVNCNIENCVKKTNISAIAYNNANINNDSMQQISTGSRKAAITPQDTYYSSAYINFATSVFNPLENKFGEYYKCVNGGLARGSSSDWNVYYDVELNRLYMNNAVLNQPMRAMGSADIVLTGDNVINCNATFAHYYDLNQKYYGDGTLTLISEPACAIMCAEGAEFDDSVAVIASTSADGSNSVQFKSEDAAYYKWIKIQPTEMPDEPEKPEEPAEESFFQKIIDAIKDFFSKIINFIIDIFD